MNLFECITDRLSQILCAKCEIMPPNILQASYFLFLQHTDAPTDASCIESSKENAAAYEKIAENSCATRSKSKVALRALDLS